MKIYIKKFLALVFFFIFAGMFFLNCTDRSRPVRITMLVLGNRPTNNRTSVVLREINKRLVSELNAELHLRHIEWSDWQTRYQLAFAAGDGSFDLAVTATDWLYGWELVRRGGFFPMTPEMLQENAPRTWEEVIPEHWEMCTLDGKIWFIPEDQYTQYTNHGVYWRGDWAREGGIYQVTTFDELEAYFDVVKQNQPQAYPWDVAGDPGGGLLNGYLTSNTNTQGILSASIFCYNNDDPYTVVCPYMDSDAMIDAAIMFNRWSQKGFWREDVMNYRGLTRDLFFAGFSGADAHHTMTYYSSIRPGMDRLQPGSDVQFFYFGMENNNVRKDIITHGAMAINATSRNPDLALRVYDLLRNDKEIYMLLNYGIYGEDYLINSEGKLERPEGWEAVTHGLATNFWAGRMDKYTPLDANWWSGTEALIEHFNSFAHEYPMLKFAFDDSNVGAELAAMNNVLVSQIGQIGFGRTRESPEQAVANLRRDLMAAGYEKVKAEVQAQLDAFWAANK